MVRQRRRGTSRPLPARLPPTETHLPGEPVRRLPGERADGPADGTALCLSGGGYRAMVFHVGVLWRLNEAGILRRLDRISSVSGGSITAAVLGMNWRELDFDGQDVARNLGTRLVEPIRAMAGRSVDVPSVVAGLALPSTSVSDRVVRAYRRHLFGAATLQQLPDRPRFLINATNLQSGVLMRFSKPYLADYRVGRVENPDVPLAVAVAASSAFPPFLSPCTVDLRRATWVTEPGNDLTAEAFRGRVRLSDGGVYDNLGLETAWKRCSRIVVSDAGGRTGPDADPPANWVGHARRVLDVVDNQVRSLRKRQVIGSLEDGRRAGVYVGIRSRVDEFPLDDALDADPGTTDALARIPTRLAALDADRQELLVNWGYAICDTGLRAHVAKDLPRGSLPYPARPLTGAATGR